jgi:hypothetical protein
VKSPTGQLYYGKLDAVADYVLLATDGDEPVAKAYSTPFAFGITGREDQGLPAVDDHFRHARAVA